MEHDGDSAVRLVGSRDAYVLRALGVAKALALPVDALRDAALGVWDRDGPFRNLAGPAMPFASFNAPPRLPRA